MSKEESEEIIYDETEGRTSDKLAKLKEELKVCKKERQDYLDGWQRSKAEFLNLKKRSAEDRINLNTELTKDFVNDLLPTVDSFEMAFKDKKAWESAPENWRKGIEYIYTQITNLLESYKVETIDPIGKELDINEHHSVESIKTDNQKEDNVVLEVVLKGYKIGDFIIRPAHVKVGSYSN